MSEWISVDKDLPNDGQIEILKILIKKVNLVEKSSEEFDYSELIYSFISELEGDG